MRKIGKLFNKTLVVDYNIENTLRKDIQLGVKVKNSKILIKERTNNGNTEIISKPDPPIKAIKFTATGPQTIALWDYDGLSLMYSYDGHSWNDFVEETNFNEDNIIYIKGDNPEGFNWSQFMFSNNDSLIDVEGNILYLIGESDTIEELPEDCFAYLFSGAPIKDASKLILTSTVSESCYSQTFMGCDKLVNAPKLPAINLVPHCYNAMFSGCSSLVKVPELPATTLAENCYYLMFSECTSLTTAPKLPATTLADSCYQNMFQGCTSLVSSPKLLATTLADKCYNSMFIYCTSLNHVTIYANDISATGCLSDWLTGVAATGTFENKTGITYPEGGNGIPSGWTEIKPE